MVDDSDRLTFECLDIKKSVLEILDILDPISAALIILQSDNANLADAVHHLKLLEQVFCELKM